MCILSGIVYNFNFIHTIRYSVYVLKIIHTIWNYTHKIFIDLILHCGVKL